MDRYIARSEIYRRFFNGRNKIIRIHVSDIDVIPDADVVAVVHGKWMVRCSGWMCSECGHVVPPDRISNYCPDCGAKMKE